MAFSQVFADIIEMKGWNEFTIIYEGAEFLPFLDNILNMEDIDADEHILISVIQLPDGEDFRSQLKTIKSSGSVNYLVSCSLKVLPLFLEQAQQVGIMSDDHSYIITNPDFQTLDIDPYKHGGSNITGIRFFDPELEDIKKFVTSINDKVKELSENQIETAIDENGLYFNIALVYDAIILYTSAIKSMGLSEGANITCDDEESWNFGSSIVNHLRTMETDGLTGPIKFDEDGFRSDFEIDVLEVMSHGLEKIGAWSLEDGFVEMRKIIPVVEEDATDSMKGKHFIILTALSAPYGMLKESSKKLEGNDRYEGFGIEIIEELAKMNEFNYTFEIQEDGVYGSLDSKTQKWNGMMEKIIDGVWGWLAGAYVGVSVLLFILGRLAPEEWQNPYPCIAEPETLDNQFTLANSFWFTLGSVLTQGSEIAPM
ncbi:unnamed protein product [Leptidea sinapis]|uniref:Ionotropic glutamate receptor L-glutamate and glycine-binding domain-containing protein n=1 Tax=Leptidea sinapis TaxID=189913 RepID=A0A5E4R763_9NEOP|nr:unnamed protein product [Leptidea sinapis]